MVGWLRSELYQSVLLNSDWLRWRLQGHWLELGLAPAGPTATLQPRHCLVLHHNTSCSHRPAVLQSINTEIFMSFNYLPPACLSPSHSGYLLLCGTRKFLNISEEAEIREVEGVIFSFPTQKKLDRLEIKFNDIEQGNLTARQPHHHKYRNI